MPPSDDVPAVRTEPQTRVSVVICTYRRPAQLTELLGRLDTLEFAGCPRPRVDVVVIDNSPDAEAAAVVAAASGRVGYPLRLVHAGAGNISIARNRGLDELPKDAHFAAWLDDDELPGPSWLDALLTVQLKTAADFVIGPVFADIPSDAPRWLRDRRLYDALDDLPDLAPLEEGITGNALAAVASLRRLSLRFDENLGHAGGEDQLFFRTARAAGAQLRFAAGATVRESVPPARLTISYLMRREYRKGNTLGMLDRAVAAGAFSGPRRPVRRVAAAGWWALSGLGGALRAAAAGEPTQVTRSLLRVVRAAGMLTGLAQLRFDQYGPALPAPGRVRAVVVVREDPQFQEAGHTRYVLAWLAHLQTRGFDVVTVLTGSRLARLVHRDGATGPSLMAPGSVRLASWSVTLHPRLVANSLIWRGLRRASPARQAVVLGLRNRWRSGQGVDHNLGEPLGPAAQEWLKKVLDRLAPNVVVFDSVFTVCPPDQLPASVRASYVITHDVVWQRAAAFLRQGYRVSPSGFTSSREAALLAGISGTVAITERDAQTFRDMLPGQDVLVVPVPVPVPLAVPATTAVTPVTGRLLFVGSASLHNVDGISWFLEQAWPQIIAAHPAATVHVAGSVCGRLPGSWPGVTLLGELASLDAEYAAASVVLVPLRTGSGMKVKTVEAVAHSRPVLSTSEGVQGLEMLAPAPFVIADTAADFAVAALALLSDEVRLTALAQAASSAAGRLGAKEAFKEFDGHLDQQRNG